GQLLAGGYYDAGSRNRGFLTKLLDSGGRDLNFGAAGILVSSQPNYRDEIHGLSLAADGKFLTAGSADLDFQVTRHASDGSPDESFGDGGRAQVSFGVSDESVQAMLLQPDGKIVAAGNSSGGDSVPCAAISRRNPDGSPDLSFGVAGSVTRPLGLFGGSIAAAALQSDGKIVLAGSIIPEWSEELCVLRFLPNGSADPSFGVDGMVITGAQATYENAHAIAVQPDGKIVVTGRTYLNGITDLLVCRYLENGTLDPSFSGDGMATADLGLSEETAYCLALQLDGKILVGGGGGGSNGFAHLALARFTEQGELDPEFSGDGMLATPLGLGSALANALAPLPDGRIVVAGNSWNGSNNDVVIARLLNNGSPDPTFSDDGVLRVARTHGSEDVLEAVFPQHDGSLLAAGRFSVGTTGGFGTLRVREDGELHLPHGTNGLALVPPGIINEYLTSAAIQKDGPPVLIRIDTSAGHGAGTALSKMIDKTADEWAFLEAV
ncbi:MAG: hypothetical protein EOP83_29045, partial [Verrucomicrobiaceae bacterium]